MKRYFIGLILVLFLFVSASADHRAVIARKNVVSDTYDDIVLWVNLEAQDCSTPCTTYTFDGTNEYSAFGNEEFATVEDDAEINETAVLDGNSNGLDLNDTVDGNDRVRIDFASGPRQALGTAGRCGLYLKTLTHVTQTIILLLFDSSGNTIRLKYYPSSEIYLDWDETTGPSDGNVQTTADAIPDTGTYFVEIIWDASQTNGSDQLEIKVDGVSEISSTSESLTADNLTIVNIYWGNSSPNLGGYYTDMLACSNDITRDLYDLIVTSGITDYPGPN